MKTHVHQVTKSGFMGHECGMANITLPGPAWNSPATAQHQRPAPEPVRLVKTAPRGIVPAKDRPAMLQISQSEYAARLASSVNKPPTYAECRKKPIDGDIRQGALLAFWHRTRRVFVPLTVSEIEEKTGARQHDRTLMAQGGLIVCTELGQGGYPGTAIYELTAHGRNIVAKMVARKGGGRIK